MGNGVSTGRFPTDALKFPGKKSRSVLLETLSHVAVLVVAICDRHMFALHYRERPFWTAKGSLDVGDDSNFGAQGGSVAMEKGSKEDCCRRHSFDCRQHGSIFRMLHRKGKEPR